MIHLEWFRISSFLGVFIILPLITIADFNESQFNFKQQIILPFTSIPVPFLFPVNVSLCGQSDCEDLTIVSNDVILYRELFDLDNDKKIESALVYSLPIDGGESNFSYERKNDTQIITYNKIDFLRAFFCYEKTYSDHPLLTCGDFIEKENSDVAFNTNLYGITTKDRSDYFFTYNYLTKTKLHQVCPTSFKFLENPKLIIVTSIENSNVTTLSLFNLKHFEDGLVEFQNGNLLLILYENRTLVLQKSTEYHFSVGLNQNTGILDIYTCTYNQNDSKNILNGTNVFALEYTPSTKIIKDIISSLSSGNVTFGPITPLNSSLIKEQILFLTGEIQSVESGVYRAKVGGKIIVLENATKNQNISLGSINITDGLKRKHVIEYDPINNEYTFEVTANFIRNPKLFPFDFYSDVFKVEPAALKKMTNRFQIGSETPFYLEYKFYEDRIELFQKRNLNFYVQFFIFPLITVSSSLFISKKFLNEKGYKKLIGIVPIGSSLIPTILGLFLTSWEIISIGSLIYGIILIIPIVFVLKLNDDLYHTLLKRIKSMKSTISSQI